MDSVIKTEFIESESVGYRQIRITFPNQVSETYFQEFKSTDGWFRLADGERAKGYLDQFIQHEVEHHQKRKADKIASLERMELNG